MGADDAQTDVNDQIGISIHGPRVGADRKLVQVKPRPEDFNPRPPCGGRHVVDQQLMGRVGISIHGPRVGADAAKGLEGLAKVDFNPRPPCGGRQIVGDDQILHSVEFQSTAPVWGPTRRR